VLDAGRRSGRDAALVLRLKAAGAVLLGKTVTTELAYYAPSKTRNPHDPARTPGGSSSGSAAAVADGHVPAALTTQTGGSTIRPASFCGIVGYKPPFGTVPNDGLRLLAPSIDTIGIHARTVADAAMVASVLEARPRTAVSNTAPRFVQVRLPAEEAAGPGLSAFMAEAVAALRAAGAAVEELAVPALAPLDSAHRVIMAIEVAREFRDIMRSDAGRLSAPLREFIERGRTEPGAALTRAHAAVTEAHRALWPIAGAGALLLCPAAGGEAPVGLSTTGDAVFSRLWSVLHLGAITIPAARGPDGLPLGVQLVDPAPAGDRLFAAAGFAERALAPLRSTCIGRRA
jgi:Asp-tRNA(Asn)/Glu-tRNA(Gln) amidotransferase A subunit family amidase